MTAIAFRFLSGRYHATPWNRHANEGVVEWPPSPWRILRALVAASYRLNPAVPRDQLRALVDKLATPPVYYVPHAAEGHTRHYMPKKTTTTLVFDAFMAVGLEAGPNADELVVGWPGLELDHAEIALLDRLLDGLGYLGRAESWVEARRTELGEQANVTPAHGGDAPPAERIRLQALLPPAELEAALASLPGSGRNARLPKDTLEVLEQRTDQLQKAGWSEAPGTQWLTYRRPGSLIRVTPAARTDPRRNPASLARYAIASPVLPRLTDAVLIGDRLRAALMSHAEDDAALLALFSGKDADGRPLDGHRHAYFLPADDNDDGFIDHLLVHAPYGFSDAARAALEAVVRLWGRDAHDLHLLLVAFGVPETYGALHSTPQQPGTTPACAAARVWESRTPVVLTRHAKLRGGEWMDTPEQQLRRLLRQHGHPEPVDVIQIAATDAGGELRWHRFRRLRTSGGGRRADARGYGFRIEFPEPEVGPIAVGYAAHAGLGQFRAVG